MDVCNTMMIMILISRKQSVDNCTMPFLGLEACEYKYVSHGAVSAVSITPLLFFSQLVFYFFCNRNHTTPQQTSSPLYDGVVHQDSSHYSKELIRQIPPPLPQAPR